ncbi:MAG TPA: chemotaxis protein CheX [Acidobacteriota bacterium]|nr:chemotaxis protein CheX [Acidobacteriota bacterium]
MLGLQVESAWVAAAAAPGVKVTSSVSLTGDWNGSILLECSGDMACTLAGILLMTECSQVDENVKDVLGEITNMIAGNVSRKLHGSTSLSLPSVVSGSHYTVDVLKGEKVVELPLFCRDRMLLVSLIRAATN